MIELMVVTSLMLSLLVLILVGFTFSEKEPLALVAALICAWFIFVSIQALNYTVIVPKKEECENNLLRTEKCVFIAVPESSLVEEIKEG